METTTSKKTVKKDYKKLILEGYVNYVLEHGNEPPSVFKFAKELKMKEEDFYTYYTSFDSIASGDTIQVHFTVTNKGIGTAKKGHTDYRKKGMFK